MPLHPEAIERVEAWLDQFGIRSDTSGPLFRQDRPVRGAGTDGFAARPLTRRAVQKLVGSYVARLGLDPGVTVHSLRVSAMFCSPTKRIATPPS